MTLQTAVERFWVQARVEGKLNRLEAVIGQNVQDTVPPPVWSSSPDPAQATRDVEELLGSGTLTQVFAMADLDDAEQVPARVGDLGIVLDGAGEPRALVRTAEVSTVDSHPQMPDAIGPVVVERLELLYPRRRKRTRDPVPA